MPPIKDVSNLTKKLAQLNRTAAYMEWRANKCIDNAIDWYSAYFDDDPAKGYIWLTTPTVNNFLRGFYKYSKCLKLN